MKPAEVSGFRALPGNGLEGTVDGRQMLGGSLRYLSGLLTLPEEIRKQADLLA